jgi:hypothetical protein
MDAVEDDDAALAAAIFAAECAAADEAAAARAPQHVRPQQPTQTGRNLIVAQQDAAYAASLARDRARERAEAEAVRAASQAAAAEAEKKARLSDTRDRIAAAFPLWDEPEEGGVRVSVRLRDGRIERRRMPDDACIGHVFTWVDQLEGHEAPPAELFTSFQRRTWTYGDAAVTLREADAAGAVLSVRDGVPLT